MTGELLIGIVVFVVYFHNKLWHIIFNPAVRRTRGWNLLTGKSAAGAEVALRTFYYVVNFQVTCHNTL